MLFERNVNEVKTRGNHADHRCFSRPTVHATELRRVGATNHRRQAAGVAGRLPVPGLVVHAAGQGPNGFRVVDVWESEDAFRRFGEKLIPILRSVGIEGEPEIYQAHTFVSA